VFENTAFQWFMAVATLIGGFASTVQIGLWLKNFANKNDAAKRVLVAVLSFCGVCFALLCLSFLPGVLGILRSEDSYISSTSIRNLPAPPWWFYCYPAYHLYIFLRKLPHCQHTPHVFFLFMERQFISSVIGGVAIILHLFLGLDFLLWFAVVGAIFSFLMILVEILEVQALVGTGGKAITFPVVSAVLQLTYVLWVLAYD
jgi:hypothetical protein